MQGASDPDPLGLPIPGGISERLWQDCQLEAYRALQHPFVVALGLGVLAKWVHTGGAASASNSPMRTDLFKHHERLQAAALSIHCCLPQSVAPLCQLMATAPPGGQCCVTMRCLRRFLCTACIALASSGPCIKPLLHVMQGLLSAVCSARCTFLAFFCTCVCRGPGQM